MNTRLSAQLAFLAEADRLKSIDRANRLLDQSRVENSAEHSWHLALYAVVFAPLLPTGGDINRVIAMLLLHDLVEIDAGDHPIHLQHDHAAIAHAESAAADRIFGLLPNEQGAALRDLWEEFEAAQTLDARFAKQLDFAQPAFQTICAPQPDPDHVAIVRENFTTGRAAWLRDQWPDAHCMIMARLNGTPCPAPADLVKRIAFLTYADRLKSVLRQTTLMDGSRRENSGEHSWHVALFALVLVEHAVDGADAARAVVMLLLHDLVEIDAGDTPLHAPDLRRAKAVEEARAADHIFGLLPTEQGAQFRTLWDEFESAQTPTAHFAKAMDRAQPPMSNLATDGENWRRFNVTYDQIETRVGTPIKRGAPAIWAALAPQISDWFAQ